ncbi:phosphoenolpyruvate mutase [Pseudoalteromonas byunsanensis]|uniref:phosphoenolpyruvate mutase n=2 Tax=Pseudoalteromonas byunsanensis TaxID=327939 RepID=A0A1S1N5B9_9GAMM|nr:phosphoenolpyruvate mutase [Pseudoalteromonas byunsanensis]
MDKCQRFRALLNSTQAEMILEAHNGMSAKIVEQAGFPAVWASGLSISSSLGLRDCNEASWSQILDIAEFINDSVDVPVLFDGDSGFGNFNNVRHVVKKLSQYGIAGISLEDKVYPKMNSFIKGAHSLVSIEEFEGKIKAAQDAKQNSDFSVIARTETLIAGLSVDEALRRAERYHLAGADAIFIHSKKSDATEILEFAKLWEKRCPLVVAPTTYADIPPETLYQAGINVYICANHLMRASLKAMQLAANKIYKARSIGHINSDIATLSEVFNLLDYSELKDAEQAYTPII